MVTSFHGKACTIGGSRASAPCHPARRAAEETFFFGEDCEAYMAYVAEGRRFAKTVDGVRTEFMYEGDEPIADFAVTGSGARYVTCQYIHGTAIDERLIYTAFNADGTQAGQQQYYHANHQGTIIAMSQASTLERQQRYTYDVYGLPGQAEDGQPFRYTGRRYDAETGLYYYRARYYSPKLGRFLQTDPIGYKDNMNLYGYVANDPVNKYDPYGLDAWVVARPLSAFKYAGHAFVVTNADYIGDPNATVHSFGPLANGNMGNMRTGTPSSGAADTYADDVAAWRSLSRGQTDNLSKINAPDDLVDAVAAGVQEDRPYSLVPRPEKTRPGRSAGGPEVIGDEAVNSNSAAFAVGYTASRAAGNGPVDRSSFSITLPGAGASGKVNISFSAETGKATITQARATTGTRIKRSVTQCVDKNKC